MTLMTLEQLKLGIKCSYTSRAVIHSIIPPFNLPTHMWRVYLLYKYLGGIEDVPAALHDAEEALTGDIPSPAKKHLQGLDYFESQRPEFLDPKEKRLCKLADKICLVLQIRPYVGFSESIMSIHEEELELLLDIAKELNKTKEVKKLLKELAS